MHCFGPLGLGQRLKESEDKFCVVSGKTVIGYQKLNFLCQNEALTQSILGTRALSLLVQGDVGAEPGGQRQLGFSAGCLFVPGPSAEMSTVTVVR